MLNSVRIKLTVLYVSALALILIAFATFSYFRVMRVLSEESDENIESVTMNVKTSIENEVKENKGHQDLETVIQEDIRESRFEDFNFAVFDNHNRRIDEPLPKEDLNNALLSLNNSAPDFMTITIGKKWMRIHSVPLKIEGQNYRLFAAYSLQGQKRFLGRLQSIYLVTIPLALILTGLAGYFLARKSLAPVLEMSQLAEKISATNLNERLPVKNEKDEFGHLARVINALLLRLEKSFEQQRRFMADASHELGTPLAIVCGEAEVTLSKKDRPNRELRESMGVILHEGERLTKIVEDLFTLASADSGQLKTRFTKIYLDVLLKDCVRAVQVLAQKRNISLDLSILEEMPLSGDDQLLRRLFLNLLDNAIKYNREGGKIFVSGEKNSDDYKIQIADTGIGIPDWEQAEVFGRFYRADKARSRSDDTVTSGSGLGLSIAQWIAEQHHGLIEIVSSNQQGSIFAVRFPLN